VFPAIVATGVNGPASSAARGLDDQFQVEPAADTFYVVRSWPSEQRGVTSGGTVTRGGTAANGCDEAYADDVNRQFSLFATPAGVCGIAWSDAGIAGLQLPEGSDTATRMRLRTRFDASEATSPAAHAAHAIAQVQALLRQEPSDLASIVLDLSGVPEFHQRVYALARRIEPGQTLTYGQVAERLGSRGLSRAVGQALGRNPFAIIVPCHRVVSASGALGGFSAHGGAALKAQLLMLEGRMRLPL
jgi:methylated-DNA-[protein]-cysteine S-methyltransferase